MSAPTNTYKHSSVIGVREDLEDMVTNISPIDTQFYTGCKKKKGTQVKHEWLTESVRAAAANAQAEGDDPTATAVTPAVRLSNTMQTQAVTFRISDIVEAVKAAGDVNSEAHQTVLFSKALAKDIELDFLTSTENTSDTYKMKGSLNWCISNVNKSGTATVNADGTVTGGTARALTEDMVKDIMQDIFTAGGDPKKIFCGPFQKRAFSSFVGTSTYRQLVEKSKVGTNVDVYVTDFGELSIVPHRIIPTDVLFIPDMDYWGKAVLIPTGKTRLAKTGRSEILDISVTHTVIAYNEAASGRVVDLQNS